MLCHFFFLIINSKSYVQNYTSLFTAFALDALSAHCASRYASQSSSSAFECRTGSGGMASDILAKAPPVSLWTSPASPPAGPFPDIPAAWTLSVNRLSTPAPFVSKSKGCLTFPPHGEFIEEIRHEVSATGCCSHRWETTQTNKATTVNSAGKQ